MNKDQYLKEYEIITEKLSNLYGSSEGFSMNALASATSDFLIKIATLCDLDEEDFRIQLNEMYQQFVEYKKIYDEISKELK